LVCCLYYICLYNLHHSSFRWRYSHVQRLFQFLFRFHLLRLSAHCMYYWSSCLFLQLLVLFVLFYVSVLRVLLSSIHSFYLLYYLYIPWCLLYFGSWLQHLYLCDFLCLFLLYYLYVFLHGVYCHLCLLYNIRAINCLLNDNKFVYADLISLGSFTIRISLSSRILKQNIVLIYLCLGFGNGAAILPTLNFCINMKLLYRTSGLIST